MNAETSIAPNDEEPSSGSTRFLGIGSSRLDTYLEKLNNLNSSLGKLAEFGDEKTAATAQRFQQRLASIEPSITMIGQVKAGKTSLVNAMVGWPDLLPADVNPWTSVVTSLHVSPQPQPDGDKAVFKFFDQKEWDRLLNKGGRIGELASRAGADEELENVREQIEQMREKSRSRLGRKFELLLGQEHDYGYFDQELIERYVCLGDDFDDDEDGLQSPGTQGRFADITKSADLFMHRPDMPINLCIRDTPGINDTFMMREQITIQAIRESRICVMVLSAHQALTSVDMALIRLISNIKSREVIIFVNRIDELSDPATQVPEIRNSIRETLKNHQGPTDAQIIFGSAYWANRALTGSLDDLSKDSALALFNWAETELECMPEQENPADMIWELSGLPALFRSLYERISEGVGQEVIDKVARNAINLANSLHATNQVIGPQVDVKSLEHVNKEGIESNLNQIEAQTLSQLQDEFTKLTDGLHSRIDRSHRGFLERATASLITHLEKNGEESVWQYNPMGLRVLLRSAYQIFGARAQGSAQKVFESAANDICDVYGRTFGDSGATFAIQAPPPPRIPPPVFLGQTIALDLQGSWWKSWWKKRRGYQAFADSFYSMIMEETDPIVNELKDTQATHIQDEAVTILREFLSDQRTILMDAVEKAESNPDDLQDLLGDQKYQDRQQIVEATLSSLNAHVA
ncbi:MAG: dynamin family protein [Marinosulfonomonas sp.]|nr:dynamin family protein [Marinosulfonomonas sp.]